MLKARPLSRDEITNAMSNTKSVRAAARYLNMSYTHTKKWMQIYKDSETGKSLFERHKNPHGVGISKFLTVNRKQAPLIDIIEGTIDVSSFSPEKIKQRLITEGFLEEKCSKCNFEERRVLDYRIPLIMHFSDNNKRNYSLKNLSLMCYNCYFLYVGDVFSKKSIEKLEDYVQKAVTLEPEERLNLDAYNIQRMKDLGLFDELEKVPEVRKPFTAEDLIAYK